MRAQIRPLKESVEAISNATLPPMDFDNRVYSEQEHWALREALIFSYHWGSASLTASDFVRLKQDCRITDILSSASEPLYIKQLEAKQFLGPVTFFQNLRS